MILTLVLFGLGFVVLIVGANWMVDGAASVAKKFNISNLVIGLTVVAFGTSAPELAVNIFANTGGNSQIAVGNVLGSNVFNILLILGVAALIYPLRVQRNTIWKEIPFSLLAALVLAIIANDVILDGDAISVLTRSDGFILLAFFIIFMFYTFESARKGNADEYVEIKEVPTWRSVLFILAGLLGLVFGGKWIVDGAVLIASSAGMSEAVIGLTVVAAGTSLPELATSAVAAFKKNTDIAIGNVVGSNIFNIFLVLGISSLISPLPFRPEANVDIAMVIISSLLLFLFIFTGKERQIGKGEGIMFLVLFVAYMGYLIIFQG